MNSFKKYQTTILVVILLIGAFYVYRTFFGGSTTVAVDQNAQQIGTDVLNLKQKLEDASFDKTLFSSPVFQSLVDFSTTIPSQPQGRSNPFDVIGRD